MDRDEEYMRQLRQAQIRSYFFGSGGVSLNPHTQVVGYEGLKIWRVGGGEWLDLVQLFIFVNVKRYC